ncbi:MAG: hypothetical protein ACOVNV_00985 [Pirellulaceae bacterium]
MELTAQGRDIIHHLAMVATGKCFLRFATTSGSHRGHAVDVFDRRRCQIIHHLAMVATGLWWRSAMDAPAKSSTIWRWWLRENVSYDLRQRLVATAATRWMSSIDVAAKSSTIWRWWLRDCGGDLRWTPLPNHPPSGDGGYGKMFLTICANGW